MSGIVEGLTLLAVPTVLGACAVLDLQQTALLSALVVVAALVVFMAGYDRSAPRLRDIVPATVLAAVAVAGRVLLAAVPSAKPVSAICIIAGIVFGRRNGFMVGALAALVSNFFMSQGAWTPWQMYAWGLVGWLAGVLEEHGLFEQRWAVLAYGFASGLLYGAILNLWSLIGFFHPQSLAQALTILAPAIPLDLVHGAATVGFLLALYVPWRTKLERVRERL